MLLLFQLFLLRTLLHTKFHLSKIGPYCSHHPSHPISARYAQFVKQDGYDFHPVQNSEYSCDECHGYDEEDQVDESAVAVQDAQEPLQNWARRHGHS